MRRFEKVLKSEKIYCILEVVVAILTPSFHLRLGRELVKKNSRAHLICDKSVMLWSLFSGLVFQREGRKGATSQQVKDFSMGAFHQEQFPWHCIQLSKL